MEVMLTYLFTTFDPSTHKTCDMPSVTWWLINFSLLLTLVSTLFVGGRRYTNSVRLYTGFLVYWLNPKHIPHMKGITLILASRVTLTLSTSIIGQLPCTFLTSFSRVFRIILCLTTRVGAIIFSLIYVLIYFLVALIALRALLVLAFIAITAKLIRNLVWFVICYVGLIVIIPLGHLNLKLAAPFYVLTLTSLSVPIVITLILIPLTVLLAFFEALIALLQAYIYCFLLIVYITGSLDVTLTIQIKALILINKRNT
jgi:hypothetical protein